MFQVTTKVATLRDVRNDSPLRRRSAARIGQGDLFNYYTRSHIAAPLGHCPSPTIRVSDSATVATSCWSGAASPTRWLKSLVSWTQIPRPPAS